MRVPFRISHPKREGVFQASRWVSYRVLLDPLEMRKLFDILPPFALYNVSDIISLDRAVFSKQTFLKEYDGFIKALKKEKCTDKPNTLFSCAISQTPEAFYAIKVKEKIIVKRIKPVIQMLPYHFTYSDEDQRFHSATCYQESVHWGIAFSYPYLYANSNNGGNVIKVMQDLSYPNTPLFRALTQWIRAHSRPASFLVKGKKIKTAIRIGDQCMKWVQHHPQLIERGLVIT